MYMHVCMYVLCTPLYIFLSCAFALPADVDSAFISSAIVTLVTSLPEEEIGVVIPSGFPVQLTSFSPVQLVLTADNQMTPIEYFVLALRNVTYSTSRQM